MMTGLQNIMTTELINNDDWIDNRAKHNDNMTTELINNDDWITKHNDNRAN